MANEIQLLDPWVGLEPEVVQGMINLSGLKINEKFIDLGSGDGRFLIAAKAKKAKPIIGYELNPEMASVVIQGATVYNADVFTADVSTADVITFWFTEAKTIDLFNKLYNEMKVGARLVCLSSSIQQWRDSAYFPSESCYDVNTGVGVLPFPTWKPTAQGEVLGNRFYLYVR